mgnify:CR=1 FL=1
MFRKGKEVFALFRILKKLYLRFGKLNIVMNSSTDLNVLQNDLSSLREEFNNFVKNSINEVQKNAKQVLPKDIEFSLGMAWGIGPTNDIGPHCQTCYDPNKPHLLYPLDVFLNIEEYENPNTLSAYCNKESKNLYLNINRSEFEKTRQKILAIKS